MKSNLEGASPHTCYRYILSDNFIIPFLTTAWVRRSDFSNFSLAAPSGAIKNEAANAAAAKITAND